MIDVTINCAISIHGCLGYVDSDDRLILSNTLDFERVNLLRYKIGAILVGANTIRKDNCSLIIKNSKNIKDIDTINSKLFKITYTKTGNLDLIKNNFFITQGKKVIYTTLNIIKQFISNSLYKHLYYRKYDDYIYYPDINLDIIRLNNDFTIRSIYHDIEQRYKIKSLLVEGGSNTISQFVECGLFNRLIIVISPVLFNNGLPFLTINQYIQLKLVKVEKMDNHLLCIYIKKEL